MSNGHWGKGAHLSFAIVTSSLFGVFNMMTSIIWIQVSYYAKGTDTNITALDLWDSLVVTKAFTLKEINL